MNIPPKQDTVLAYVIKDQSYFYTDKQPFAHETEGKNYFDFNTDPRASNGTLILFEDGKTVHIETKVFLCREKQLFKYET